MPVELLIDGFSCRDKCKLFNKCRELCAPMVYMLGKLEYEPPRETQLTGERGMDAQGSAWPDIPKRTGESILNLYFSERKSVAHIAEQLDVSRSYVYKIINKAQRLIEANTK